MSMISIHSRTRDVNVTPTSPSRTTTNERTNERTNVTNGKNQCHLDPEKLMKLWNDQDCLPKCKILGDLRKSHAKAQILKYPDLEHWVAAKKGFTSSQFCITQWKPNFDIFLNEGKRLKSIEGFYSQNRSPKSFEQQNMDNLRNINEKAKRGELFT